MKKESTYYREKLIKLLNKLYLEIGDARYRFIHCEDEFEMTYLASKEENIPKKVKEFWEKMWCELNKNKEIIFKSNNLVLSSFSHTVKSKKNKTMTKYLEFILEEYNRLVTKLITNE